MDEKKTSKGLKVLVVFLIILLLGAGLFIYYGYTKYDSLDKKYNVLNDKYDSVTKENNKEEINSEYITYKYSANEEPMKIYYDYGFAKVISYKSQVYGVESSDASSIYNDILIQCINDNSACKEGSEEDEDYKEIYVKKLDINENDIHKVVINHSAPATDPQYDTFIITKSGEVFLAPSHVTNPLQNVFKQYKVEDVSEYCQKPSQIARCDVTGYELTLIDKTTKNVIKLD